MAASPTPAVQSRTSRRRLGLAWISLWCALALHVADEAVNGFLFIYNPTVTALRERLGYWPMPTFTFEGWFTALAVGILLLVALTPFAFLNPRWMRPLIYLTAVLCILNAGGHTLATIFGRTVATVHFSRPAPGFLSSPILLFAGIYALVQLRRTRKGSAS